MIHHPPVSQVPIHYLEGRKTTKGELVQYMKSTDDYKRKARERAIKKNREWKHGTCKAENFFNRLWKIDPGVSGWRT